MELWIGGIPESGEMIQGVHLGEGLAWYCASRDVMVLRSFQVPWERHSKKPTRDLILVVRRPCSCCGRETSGMLSIGWPGQKSVGLVVDESVDKHA
eukprot:9065060-Ditylum_brightwellii.AAC.1